MKSNHSRNAIPIAVLTACALLFLSCSQIQNLLNKETEKVVVTIPEGVLDVAEGVFGLIGLVFASESSDPALGTYPSGMTASWIVQDTKLRLSFADFTPPDDTSGTKANGSITLTRMSGSPLAMTFVGALTMANYAYGSVSIDATATWPAGSTDPGQADPSSVSGSLTVDGTAYDIAAVRDALEDRENGDGTTPVSFPVPDAYKGAQLHSSLRNGALDTSVIFYISGDGKYFTMQEGSLTCEGYIKWYTDGEWQLLHFYDNLGANNRLYVVMESAYDYLLLHIQADSMWVTWRFDVVRY